MALKKLLCRKFIPLGQAPLRQAEKPATLGYGFDRGGKFFFQKVQEFII